MSNHSQSNQNGNMGDYLWFDKGKKWDKAELERGAAVLLHALADESWSQALFDADSNEYQIIMVIIIIFFKQKWKIWCKNEQSCIMAQLQ